MSSSSMEGTRGQCQQCPTNFPTCKHRKGHGEMPVAQDGKPKVVTNSIMSIFKYISATRHGNRLPARPCLTLSDGLHGLPSWRESGHLPVLIAWRLHDKAHMMQYIVSHPRQPHEQSSVLCCTVNSCRNPVTTLHHQKPMAPSVRENFTPST